MKNSDRIEKIITLRAPRARVWRALTEAKEFGAWFGISFDGSFVAGDRVTGRMTDASCGHEGLSMEIAIERIEPETLFSYRWHPYAVDPNVDYSSEPATLVEFHLEEVEDGTKLTVVESGFDRIPAARREEALRMNDGGWSAQLANIEAYVTR